MAYASIVVISTILFTNTEPRVPNDKSTKQKQFRDPANRETTMSGSSKTTQLDDSLSAPLLCSYHLSTSFKGFLFKENLCFGSISIKSLALLDSRLATCFIDTTFTQNHKILAVWILKSISIKTINRKMCSLDKVTEVMTPLVLWIHSHQEELIFISLTHPEIQSSSDSMVGDAQSSGGLVFHLDSMERRSQLDLSNTSLTSSGIDEWYFYNIFSYFSEVCWNVFSSNEEWF